MHRKSIRLFTLGFLFLAFVSFPGNTSSLKRLQFNRPAMTGEAQFQVGNVLINQQLLPLLEQSSLSLNDENASGSITITVDPEGADTLGIAVVYNGNTASVLVRYSPNHRLATLDPAFPVQDFFDLLGEFNGSSLGQAVSALAQEARAELENSTGEINKVCPGSGNPNAPLYKRELKDSFRCVSTSALIAPAISAAWRIIKATYDAAGCIGQVAGCAGSSGGSYSYSDCIVDSSC